jgi:hypothetical protein
MSGFIYILSATTCLLCAVLLLRSFMQRHVRLLLWAGLCFLGLMLENVLMYIDIVVYPVEFDLSVWRKVPGLIALLLLVFGLVWDSK